MNTLKTLTAAAALMLVAGAAQAECLDHGTYAGCPQADPSRPSSDSYIPDAQVIPMLTMASYNMHLACKNDIPDAPPNMYCEEARIIDGIDKYLLANAMTSLDVHAKNCLYLGIARGQLNVLSSCKLDGVRGAREYAAALRVLLQ
jgi:hypothetical protein